MIPGTALSPNQQLAVEQALNQVILPARFGQLERLLEAAGRVYFVGKSLTIADLAVYSMLSQLIAGSYCIGIDSRVVAKGCPALLDLVQRVGDHPAVAKWNADHCQ